MKHSYSPTSTVKCGGAPAGHREPNKSASAQIGGNVPGNARLPGHGQAHTDQKKDTPRKGVHGYGG